jgi:hypothetical protein
LQIVADFELERSLPDYALTRSIRGYGCARLEGAAARFV